MNTGWVSASRLCGLFLCSATAQGTPVIDSIRLPIIATLPNSNSVEHFPVGDADHDGWNELYYQGRLPLGDSLYAFECCGGNQFLAFPLLGGYQKAYEVCDADRDSLSDVLCSYSDEHDDGHYAMVTVEAPDEHSLPSETTEVARLRPATHWNAWVADLDGDSADEVFYSGDYDYGVIVYECTGNNRYSLVDTLDVPYPVLGMCWGDADRDGRPEVFVGGYDRYVTVFEATADDVYEVTAVCSTQTEGACRVLYAGDMDRDGKHEFVVYGGYSISEAFIEIFECTDDDSYGLVWRVDLPSYSFRRFCVGDIEGDGRQEFAIYDGQGISLYKCTGNDQYAEVWRSEECWTSIALRDVNGNGRDELIHKHDFGDSMCTVLRELPDSGAVAESRTRRPGCVSVCPSVVRRTPVRIGGVQNDAEVEVVDISGRTIARPKDGVWNPKGTAPGAYFIRIRDGSQVVVRKVLVLR